MSMNQFKEKFIKNLTHEELITEYEAKFALCEHLEDEVQRLTRERSRLAEEVVSLEIKLRTSEAKLSEHEKGLPIEKAKEGRKWVLAKFKDDLSHVTFAEQFEGRWMVIRHGGFGDDGYDFGWGFVGHGGFSDECFEKLLPLPSQTKEGS